MTSAADVRAALANESCFRSNYIDGAFVPAQGGATYATISPFTEQVVHDLCPASDARDVEAAIAAARRAADQGYARWGALTATERASYVHALAQKLQEQAPLLSALESSDMGKPIIDAGADIARCAAEVEEIVKLAAELDARQGQASFDSPDVAGSKRYDPMGVVACITPWNFPLLVTVQKLAPALTAGNTVVLKPSEYSPLTTMYAAKLCHEVGFPKGVVNFISVSADQPMS